MEREEVEAIKKRLDAALKAEDELSEEGITILESLNDIGFLIEAVDAAQGERDQAHEAVKVLSEGKPLGPLVGGHIILNQQAEIDRLTKELEAAREDTKRDDQEAKAAWTALGDMAANKSSLADGIRNLQQVCVSAIENAETLEKEAAGLRESLKTHCHHLPWCNTQANYFIGPCNCGLEKALSQGEGRK